MKKIITFSIICIMASILFSSCKSNSSIIKRHYNKGYYVSHSKSKQLKPRADAAPAENLVKIEPPFYSLKTETEQTLLKESNNPSTIATTNAITANGAKVQGKNNSETRINQSTNYKPLTINKPLKQLKQPFLNFNADHDHDGDGLSLFWIIILVLLILWALGFSLGALGGLVHILLVIALIFLILWLLHIV